MKNTYSHYYLLLMLALASCSRQNFTPISQVNDDSYWVEKDDERTPGKKLDEIEPWNGKKEGQSNPTPSRYNNEANPPSSSQSYEDSRGRAARQAWDNQRNNEQAQSSNSQDFSQENFTNEELDQREMDRDSRRFGSNRTFYYDDPYYQVLSPNWGWTNLYAPVVRPGFFNWAPGWNVGLSWNSFNGFGMGMGMQFGYGFGYNPFFYDPWMYGGAWGMAFYNPYSPWGFNPWYNPYRFGFGCGGFYDPWGFRNNHHFGPGGGDVVTNRPLMQPRQSMGSSIPSAVGSNRPNYQNFDGKSVRDSRPSPTQNSDGSATTPRNTQDGGIRYTPDRPAVTAPSNRPGGELRPDQSGRPVYVSPNNNSPIRNAEIQPGTSTRPGGELREGRNGAPVYIPPSRSRNEGGDNRPSINTDRPTRSYDGGMPDRNPRNARPSFESPRNSGGEGGYRPAPSQPAPSRPSYSAPSPSSRPSYSAPASRPPAGGGGMRPR
jgi:hypothetical protein